MSRRLTRKHLGDKFCEGARLLWMVIIRRRLTFRDAGDLAGLAEGVINRFLYGDRLPGRETAETLWRVYEVPFSSWSQRPRATFQVPERLAA